MPSPRLPMGTWGVPGWNPKRIPPEPPSTQGWLASEEVYRLQVLLKDDHRFNNLGFPPLLDDLVPYAPHFTGV